MRKEYKVGLLLLTALLAAGCGGNPASSSSLDEASSSEEGAVPEDSWTYSKRIRYVRDNGMVTGTNAHVSTASYKLTGTDLGFSYYDPSIKRYYCVYGDTSGSNGGIWNSNITLYTDDLDFSEGINWQGYLKGAFGSHSQVTPVTKNVADSNGYAYDASLVTCTDVSTTIPTGAAVVNGVYYLFYMEVGQFQDNGEWDVFASGAVKSSDQGKTWNVVTGLRWIGKDKDGVAGNGKNFGQIFPLVADDYLYIYGIPGGRSGGVQLGRAALADVDDYSKYEYFTGLDANGDPKWAEGDAGLTSINNKDSSYIVSPSCGELSVCYNPYLQRYMMTYMQNNSQIVMRRSVNPWGEWSGSDTFMKQSDLPNLYGGLTAPSLFEDGGKKIYLMVSEWWPTYNVHQIEVEFN